MVLADTILVTYMTVLLLLASNGLHRGWLIAALRHAPPELPRAPDFQPRVTVQLPLFNEPLVFHDAIMCLADLEWPRDRLQIQILDDSTDGTQDQTRALADQLQEQGIDVEWRHRVDRSGFKAGALAAGIPTATGEFIAVFDADFRPEPTFLREMMPSFIDAGVDVVQARWGHLNDETDALTAAQATLLDGHFMVEHAARFRAGHWFNFNGTAGIWRKTAIAKGGGWSGDTLTEDLDLSYRTQLAGGRFVLRDDVVAPAELPPNLMAFRSQQHRWAKGSLQVARKLMGPIWTSQASFSQKLEASTHLLANLSHPLVVLLAMLLPLVPWSRSHTSIWMPPGMDIVVLAFAVLPFVAYYGVGGWRSNSEDPWRRWRALPAALALGVGMSVSQARATLQGLGGPVGEFVRTPKGGLSDAARDDARLGLEASLAMWSIGGALWNGLEGYWGSVPFIVLFATGFTWVSWRGAVERLVARRS